LSEILRPSIISIGSPLQLLGNIFGGVFMVSLLNYGQVKLGGGGEADTRLPKAG